ncbi:MAG TPA: protein-disulfide reductase DsbD domain-containing protein [Candidatus Angelobacter sp.]
MEAEPVQAHHARVELIAEQGSAASNQQLWLGLHFSLEKDWHIYWVNPGDSGLPPTLKWQLPAGFTAGEIQWPRPEKLKRSTLADYGYQDDVVLLVPLRVPAGPGNGSHADVGLQAKWLICREVCIPDHANLHLPLPAQSDPKTTAIFTEARKHLPQPWPRSWKASAVSDKDDFVLFIQSGKPISTAEFYPLAAEQIENATSQPVQATAQGAKITLKKSDQLLQPIRVLKGLLVLGDGDAYMIQVPVTPAPKKAHNN